MKRMISLIIVLVLLVCFGSSLAEEYDNIHLLWDTDLDEYTLTQLADKIYKEKGIVFERSNGVAIRSERDQEITLFGYKYELIGNHFENGTKQLWITFDRVPKEEGQTMFAKIYEELCNKYGEPTYACYDLYTISEFDFSSSSYLHDPMYHDRYTIDPADLPSMNFRDTLESWELIETEPDDRGDYRGEIVVHVYFNNIEYEMNFQRSWKTDLAYLHFYNVPLKPSKEEIKESKNVNTYVDTGF